jgi:hypothetical protein
MRRFLTTLHAAALTFATLLLISATWFVVSVVKEGRRSFFWKFESEPAEGWDYWRQRQLHENMLGDIVFGLIVTALFILIGWGWYRFWRKLIKRRQTDQS